MSLIYSAAILFTTKIVENLFFWGREDRGNSHEMAFESWELFTKPNTYFNLFTYIFQFLISSSSFKLLS